MYNIMIKSILTMMLLQFVNSFTPSAIRMLSPSDIYLRSLSLRQTQLTSYPVLDILNKNDVTELMRKATTYTQPEKEVDTIIFNIYKIDKVFFNKNSRTISFTLRENMRDLYIYENNIMHRFTNSTKIYTKGFKNFVFLPMSLDVPVDGLLYKDERI